MKSAIVGIGGMGTSVLNDYIEAFGENSRDGVRTITINRSQKSLESSKAEYKMGIVVPNDCSVADGNVSPTYWLKLVEIYEEQIHELLSNSERVIVVAGLGGLAGSYTCPYVAKIAKNLGAQVKAIVTTPMVFEGKRRYEVAEAALTDLRAFSDDVKVISGEELLASAGPDDETSNFFSRTDEVIAHFVYELVVSE
ncbi:hypothetical protein RQN30_00125 [Arcanobacterium hippocoleae]